MSLATWPLSLPQHFQVRGLKFSSVDNLIRSKATAGVGSRRPRWTAVAKPFSGEMLMTVAQWHFLEDFFEETLSFGSLDFEWIHPVKQTACVMQFESAPVPDNEGSLYRRVILNLVIKP